VQKYLGAVILVVVVAVAVVWQWQKSQRPSSLTVVGRVGGEKIGFLHDPQVQKLLRNRYGLTINAQKYGSVEMVTEPATGQDFLWPASEINLESYRERGGHLSDSHNIFHSPIVFYSWDLVTDALIKRGLVEKQGPSYAVSGLAEFIKLVEERVSWADLGLPQLYGTAKIVATDPTKSNSGNSFAGLLANMLNDGAVVNATETARLTALLPRLSTFFARIGFLEHSSGVLWDKFISQGVGAYPLIVGYENQLVEYSLEHPELLDLLRQKVRILYPQPTVWSSHPMIALTAGGKRLLEALQDPDVQRLAWERHGFRSGLLGVQQDLWPLQVVGLPETINAVMPMPHAMVMQRIEKTLSARP